MTEGTSTVPRALYRLQLNKDFAFGNVAALAPYLAGLGVSHAYLSPILEARRGSTHGYDVVDHASINPDLGTLDDFRAMAHELRNHGVGIVVDIVPNHMAVGGADNLYWLDLLEWGHESLYAHWFDVDWSPAAPELAGRILVPLLGEPYEEALRSGVLRLAFDSEAGAFAFWAEATHKLPVAPRTYAGILAACGEDLRRLGAEFGALRRGGREEAHMLQERLARLNAHRPDLALAITAAVAQLNKDHAALDDLLAAQNWRAAHHSAAARRINYRRFFIVNELASIRIEEEDVFDRVHALTFQLVAEGLVDGIRVDHVDGLFDPKAYCLALRRKCPRPIYVAVEKILAPNEWLRPDWAVDGTTGYEFAARATSLLADPQGESRLDTAYAAFAGRQEPLREIERKAKLGIIDRDMAAEFEALARRLHQLALAGPQTAHLDREDIGRVLRQLVACLPVYRTYAASDGASWRDRRSIAVAAARARRVEPSLDTTALAFVRNLPDRGGETLELSRRIQQYTGAVMAKGLEDTALYRYNRLIALNDVGARPDRFATGVAAVHDFNRRRHAEAPEGMLATSTHDSKRGEDTRARIVALSGFATEWADLVPHWHRLLVDAGAPEPDPNDVWYLFQQLLGAWPAAFAPDAALDPQALSAFAARVEAAMLKAVREARVHSSWSAPDEAYEAKVSRYVRTAIAPPGNSPFLASFRRFEQQVGWAGAQNGLVMTVLKLTAPGVPDIYQGAELWEQSMVDPDNRRPVDFDLRRGLLAELDPARPMPETATWRSGRLKLAVITRLLRLRKEQSELFARGTYEPLSARGEDAERICAFARRHGDHAVIVTAALWPWRGPCGNCAVEPPPNLRDRRWRDILSGTTLPETAPIGGESTFAKLPAAVFVPEN